MSGRDVSRVTLMYHELVDPSLAGGRAEQWFSVPPSAFAAQLRGIRALGFAGASRARLVDIAGPAVGITFDDGRLSDYTVAFPALLEAGMTATFYVVSSWVGTPGFASWTQLREMQTHGMSIQSHTHSHPFLSELDAAALRTELTTSRTMIADGIGASVDEIAFPGGDAPRRALRAMLADCGYRVAATSRWGRSSVSVRTTSVRYVRRCTVTGSPDPERFARILRGDLAIALPRQLRETVLGTARRILGPTRYATLRRRALGSEGAPG